MRHTLQTKWLFNHSPPHFSLAAPKVMASWVRRVMGPNLHYFSSLLFPSLEWEPPLLLLPLPHWECERGFRLGFGGGGQQNPPPCPEVVVVG